MSDSENDFEDVTYCLDDETGKFQFVGFNSGNENLNNNSKDNDVSLETVTSIDDDSDSDYGLNDVVFDQTPEKLVIKKRRKKDPSNWAKTLNQRKRLKGESFVGKKKINDNKWVYDIAKPSKAMKPACSCKTPKNRKSKKGKKDKKPGSLKCGEFTEKERQAIFDTFWKGYNSWQEKRLFISTMVLRKTPTNLRNRLVESESRRGVTLKYHLKTEDKILPVCKTMFLNTLSITQKIVYKALHSFEPNDTNSESKIKRELQLKRKEKSVNSVNGRKKASAQSFLSKLNKMESHYCRSSSSKEYLEPMWESMQDLYRAYKDNCVEEKLPALGPTCFFETFEEMNLSLFSPKKDQCDLCAGFKHGHIDKTTYELHLINKACAQAEKTNDTMIKRHTCNGDVERVLLSPLLRASMSYFKMKLALHNYTIFDNVTKEGFCYLWHEGEGGVTANNFASLLCKYIDERDIPPGDEFIFYSDGCTAQNRNVFMANALLNLAVQKRITIYQKYLEKGHTQMECDSMHSTIERKLKGKEVYCPKAYIKACLKARRKPNRYHVEYLDHTYFKDFGAVQFFNSIRPGKGKGDPKVTDLRCLKYMPTGEVQYKIYYTDEWKTLPQTCNAQVDSIPLQSVPCLYNSACKITTKKYNDLQDLKEVIPKKYHAFYDNLSHG